MKWRVMGLEARFEKIMVPMEISVISIIDA